MSKLPAIRKPKKRTIDDVFLAIEVMEAQIVQLRSDLITTFHDECCHKRQSISKVLGQRLINKLQDEDKARRHTSGEL